jgi:hypothetical protein
MRRSVKVVQARRITEFEEASTNLKIEKENVDAGYRKQANKYKRTQSQSD